MSKSFENQKMLCKLVENINKYPPNLKNRIFNINNRTFLEEILTEMPQHKILSRCLKRLIEEQTININNQLPNGHKVLSKLRSIGVEESWIRTISSAALNKNIFVIYCKSTRRRQTLDLLTSQHVADLIEKTKSMKFYENATYQDNINYHLSVTLTDCQTNAEFNSGYIRYTGILNYANIFSLDKTIQSLTWKILDFEQWKECLFTQNESEIICKELYNSRRGVNKTITVKMSKQKMMVEIDCDTLQVKKIVHQGPESSYLTKFGYLIYIPSHKKKSAIKEVYLPQEPINPYVSFENITPQPKQPKVHNFNVIFESLGVFRSYFDIHTGFEIDDDQNVSTEKKSNIEYFKTFEEITLFELIEDSLSQQVMKQKNRKVSNRFSINRKKYASFVKQFKLLLNRLQKNTIQTNIDQNKSELQIVNLKEDNQARKFFSTLLEYLNIKISKKSNTKISEIKLSKFQVDCVENFKPSNLRILDKIDNNIIIQGSKESRNQLIQAMQTLDEIQEFTYEHPEAYELMKKLHEQVLNKMNVQQVQIEDDTFKVKMRLRDHPQFRKLLFDCYQKILQLPGQMKQIRKAQEAQFLHIYRAQMQKLDPEINVSKFSNDILIQYNSKLENRIKDVLSKIDQLKNKEFFQLMKKSSKEYALKNMQPQLVHLLKQKFEKILEEKAKMSLIPQVNISFVAQNKFIVKVSQISQEQQYLFDISMQNFNQRYQELMKIKAKINDTNKFLIHETNKLPKKKLSPSISKLLESFTKFHTNKIVKIIDSVTRIRHLKLEKEFYEFIQNNQLDNSFGSKQDENSAEQIQKQIKQLNIFGRLYIDEFIRQIEVQQRIQATKDAKQRIIKDIELIVKQTTQKYNNNNLKASDIEKYFTSLNILGRIYLGQQLQITPHLQTLRDKLQKNDCLMVKIGTGTGKSTVIPPYLIAIGKQRVLVTQPRRLPCRQIYKRIKKMFGKGISGYEVGDGKEDANNRLIYMTDGFLKMKALFDFKVFDEIDVLMIDEIHQRSASIDILLLLLYVYYQMTNRKLKLILCSATIDTKIGNLMKEAGLKIDTFFTQTNRHKVTQHPIQQGNIIDKVLQLSKRLMVDQQLLVFLPGVRQVNDTVAILNEKYHKNAYPITANQNPIQQEKYLQTGSIFIATSIAQTSLTFKKLKFVIDSRLSRTRKFNSALQIMETEEDFSSNSSIQQRKGRLGRTCPGQYHYFVYNSYDFTNNKQHNPTQLEKIDFTTYIFQLLLRQGSSFNSVKTLIAKLKHEGSQFDQKIQYSSKILQGLKILKENGTLENSARKLLAYGNLGNPQHNYAIYQGSLTNCQVNIIYLTSFFMVAENLSSEILKSIKSIYQGGDIKIIHDFIAKIVEEIQLRTLNESQVMIKMEQNCPYIADKSWFKTVYRVIMKVKQLFRTCNNFVLNTNWNQVIAVLVKSYNTKLFFNQSLFGGNSNKFQKMRDNVIFNFEQQKIQQKITYKLNNNSALYKVNALPQLILSISCTISPENQCILNICEEISTQLVTGKVKVTIKGAQCDQKYFIKIPAIKQGEILNQIQLEIRSKYHRIKVDYAFPNMIFFGGFKEVSHAFATIIQPKRRNDEIQLNLKIILEQAIQRRLKRVKGDHQKMMPSIEPELTRSLLQQLNNHDLKTMFQTTKFEMLNNYGVQIDWDVRQYDSCLIARKIKNIQIQKLLWKLVCFSRWLADCQTLCKQQYKIKPRHLEQGFHLGKEGKEKIVKRINIIVDSRIDRHVIKGYVKGKGPQTKYPRTAKMIAVCWVLTTVFNCVIKGGFVRDWIVNGEEYLPAGDLSKLLQKNPRNGYLQVLDDKVTPSDIDAQLSTFELFDEERFMKQMAKLGIPIIIEKDGWRKHIIFDVGSPTGGFTADLIEPYTSMCHDTYDYDANILYLKKDNLNSLGQKIPLEFNNQKQGISLEEIISSIRKKEMKKLKQNIPSYRDKKFTTRGWKILQNQDYTPIIYKNYTTQSSPIPATEIQKISPTFYAKMVQNGAKVIKIESLRNKAWDDSYDAIENFIVTEQERAEKKADPVNYKQRRINSNSKMLFHGSKNLGIKGIKQIGFDSRCFLPTGLYGRGAYFADDPTLSDGFTQRDSQGQKQMFIVRVALGKQEVLNVASNNKLGPSKGYHSILGIAGNHTEYIIERWGQAKPIYLITYTK